MKLTLDIPPVSKCTVTACAYNNSEMCHARAITIGNHDRAQCDTFLPSAAHARSAETAGVGACKTINCVYNADFECSAGSISVSGAAADAACATFKRR